MNEGRSEIERVHPESFKVIQATEGQRKWEAQRSVYIKKLVRV